MTAPVVACPVCGGEGILCNGLDGPAAADWGCEVCHESGTIPAEDLDCWLERMTAIP